MHILLRGRDIDNFKQLDVYERHGGFAGMKKALAMTPADVIDVVKASGLRGRGGAGFPTGVKWSFIPQHEPVKFVTVNADESETGTFKDREIMEENPYQLIEGSLICAYAIQAKAVYIYLRGEFWDIGDQLDECIEALRAKGYVGENIMGSGYDLRGLHAPRRRRLYLRRRERAAQQSRRLSGAAACASAISGAKGRGAV